MSKNHRDKRRDDNEDLIVEALRLAEATVVKIDAHDAPDLLVGFRQDNYLLEVKQPGKRLQSGQAEFFMWWRGRRPVVVYDPRDALDSIGLDAAEIDSILGRLARGERARAFPV